MTRTERAAAKKAEAERRAKRIAEAESIVATGVCPECGTGLRRNLSLAGWWQCDALGEPSFRRPENAAKPRCSFQTFTE